MKPLLLIKNTFLTMTPIQTEIDFTAVVHTKENNSKSEATLHEQYERLNNNCKILYDALKRGEKLTGRIIQRRFDMSEYRRRIKDLKDAGIPIQENKLKGGCKEWFIEKEPQC
jgi:hypothetical protein